MTFPEALKAAGDLPEIPVTILHEVSGHYLLMSADGTVCSDDEEVDSFPHFTTLLMDGWTVETRVDHAG